MKDAAAYLTLHMDVFPAVSVPDILIKKCSAALPGKPLNHSLRRHGVDISVDGADADGSIPAQILCNFFHRELPIAVLLQKGKQPPALLGMIFFHSALHSTVLLQFQA